VSVVFRVASGPAHHLGDPPGALACLACSLEHIDRALASP